MSLSSEELSRYARHLVLPEIGGPGQQRLGAARVLVVGAGGLGSPVLLYLAAAGVGTLRVVDDDAVSLGNLQRQVMFRGGDVGQPKVAAAGAALRALNPHVVVEPVLARLDAGLAGALVPEADLVLDGSDNFETRYLVNAACVAAGVPLVSGAMSRWEGQVGLFHPAEGGPCYRCLFPQAPDPALVPPCAQAGVVGALPGVIGSLMALEAIKRIAGAGTGLRGQLLLYDGLHAEARRIGIRPRADCADCHGAGAEPAA